MTAIILDVKTAEAPTACCSLGPFSIGWRTCNCFKRRKRKKVGERLTDSRARSESAVEIVTCESQPTTSLVVPVTTTKTTLAEGSSSRRHILAKVIKGLRGYRQISLI